GPGKRHTIHKPKVSRLLGEIARHYDFGTSQSPVAPGYVGVAATPYSAVLGYGWTGSWPIYTADRGINDPLKRDLNYGHVGSFRVDIPNGTYNVTVTLGDAKFMHDKVALWGQGQLVASGLTTAAGQFIQPTFTVKVGNGHFDLWIADMGGRDPNFAIDAL